MRRHLWLLLEAPCFEADARLVGASLNTRGLDSLCNLKEALCAVSVATFRAQSFGWLTCIPSGAFLLTARLQEHQGSVLQCMNRKFHD